ncbi:unnamed protein product [Closterium sp. Yama58-4]|nr:unnamed protein product [Closterium sp. Yama58-4]
MFQDCGYPSRSLWQSLRRRHLLHPSGIPLFNPDWTYRSHRPLSTAEARSFPPNWVVVLAKRPEGRRSLVNFREVEEEVVRWFGRNRVMLFDGSLSILQATTALSSFSRLPFFCYDLDGLSKMMVARAGRWLLWVVVAVDLTISVNASAINGQQSPSLHLAGQVAKFESELNYYLPERIRTHPERVSLVTRPLGFPLSTARLSTVFLHFFEHLPLDNLESRSSSGDHIGSKSSTSVDSASVERASVESASVESASVESASVESASIESGSASEESALEESASQESLSGDSSTGGSKWAVKLGCQGPPCPAFGSCTARFPNVQACWNPDLVDPPMSETIPPINCPLKTDSTGRDDRNQKEVPFDETCSHKQDMGVHGAYALQMIRLEDVFVTDNGFTLNRTHLFVRNGCGHFPGTVTFEANHMVHELPTAVFNWAHQPGSNFFHFLIELFPLFLVAAPLTPSPLRDLLVLAREGQVHMYEQLGLPLIGIPLDQIRLLPTSGNDLVHADVVYQPIYQNCHHASRALWQSLRRRHLLHPSGVPLFNPDWTLRNHRPLSAREARSFPSDWVVVLAKRPTGRKRAIVDFEEVEEEVVRRFGRERVVLFDGSLSILQARALLMRARLYIAGHGAALTNMIFMPEKASLLEIRPQGCPVPVYNGLASACSLRYHLVFSQGTCLSTVVANVTSVARVLDGIHARFQTEDNGGQGGVGNHPV